MRSLGAGVAFSESIGAETLFDLRDCIATLISYTYDLE